VVLLWCCGLLLPRRGLEATPGRNGRFDRTTTGAIGSRTGKAWHRLSLRGGDAVKGCLAVPGHELFF
jgi:hypothetical protein